jgi:ATP-binding cassette subfamily F protein uup
LSGGEKRRLQLLLVLIAQPNFLIMDEPTNDLDLVSLQVLEDYLEKFKGCLLLVSHDRYFMDRLVDHMFVFEGEGFIRDFPGNYTDYRLSQSEGRLSQSKGRLGTASSVTASADPPANQANKPAQTTTKNKQRGTKPTYAQTRRYEELTKRLEVIRAEKTDLIEKLNRSGAAPDEYASWGKALQALESEEEKVEWEWLELSVALEP